MGDLRRHVHKQGRGRNAAPSRGDVGPRDPRGVDRHVSQPRCAHAPPRGPSTRLRTELHDLRRRRRVTTRLEDDGKARLRSQLEGRDTRERPSRDRSRQESRRRCIRVREGGVGLRLTGRTRRTRGFSALPRGASPRERDGLRRSRVPRDASPRAPPRSTRTLLADSYLSGRVSRYQQDPGLFALSSANTGTSPSSATTISRSIDGAGPT